MFERFYKAILDMIPDVVLDVQVARDILRKSGWQPTAGSDGGGDGGGGGDLGGLIPPGGEPGDVLWYSYGSPPGAPDTWVPFWEKPDYLQHIEEGWAVDRARPHLGDDHPVALYTLALRNIDYTVGASPTNNSRAVNIPIVEDALRRQELLVWESIPAGMWYYPFNVEWFVTKRELSVPGKYLARQIKLRTGWVQGSPDATLHFRYSTTATSWTTLVSVSLAGGGVKNSGWVDFNEAAAADVYLGVFLEAHSSITSLHMGMIEVLMRWAPRGTLIPEEFLP